jgi:Na+/melibiose symporter-like transporter
VAQQRRERRAQSDARFRNHDRPKTSVFGAIFDIRVIVLALVQFGFTLGSYGIQIWMPLLLREEGMGDAEIAILLFVPYAVAILGMLGWAWLADRTGNKVGNLTLACLLGAAGFGLYYFWTGSFTLGLVNLTLALVGITAARAIFWSIPPRLLTGHRRGKRYRLYQYGGNDRRLCRTLWDGLSAGCDRGFFVRNPAMAGVMAVTTVLALSLKLTVKQE